LCSSKQLRFDGECFGGEIMDSMREAGIALRVDRLEILLTRTVLVQTMESLGEEYPAVVLQDYEHRMPVSKALKCLTETIDWTRRRKLSDEGLRSKEDGAGLLPGTAPVQQSIQS
jgi:hypothetical protein